MWANVQSLRTLLFLLTPSHGHLSTATERIGRGGVIVVGVSDQVWRRLLSISSPGRDGVVSCCEIGF